MCRPQLGQKVRKGHSEEEKEEILGAITGLTGVVIDKEADNYQGILGAITEIAVGHQALE